jgi:hypothetical protein
MKQLTAEENLECREHIDRLLEITSGLKLSDLFETVRKQMNLSEKDEQAVFDVVQKIVYDGINDSFIRAGMELQATINNPAKQAEILSALRGT